MELEKSNLGAHSGPKMHLHQIGLALVSCIDRDMVEVSKKKFAI